MDGTHSTCVLLDRLPFVDCFGFDLECLLNCGKHLDQLSDLVKTVLTFFDGVNGEMERYFLEAVGDIKSDLATFAVCLAAGRSFPCIFDDRDNISPHIEFLVQEQTFPNVVFLAHFLFLNFVLLKDAEVVDLRHVPAN